MRFYWMILVLIGLLAGPAAAQDTTYDLTPVAEGFNRPLYITNAGDDSGRLFVLEQAGLIRIVQDGAVLATPFMDLSDRVSQDVLRSYSERGLLGLAFHPNYVENGEFFVHYSNNTDGGTVISRFMVTEDANIGDPASEEILFTLAQPYANHNGGEIAFGPDGYLYISLGDGGSAGDPLNAGQAPDNLLGTILRIDVDGDAPYAIPEDNPHFTGSPALAPEVWAWGLRNPWRFSFDRDTGDLYIADVGQNQWEEVNFEPADSTGGLNYGWRVFEADQRYSGEPDPGGTVFPIAAYNHAQGCSITGGYVYRGEDLPELAGTYFFGDWCSGRIWATERDDSGAWQTREFLSSGRQISSFGQDERGELYVADYSRGVILKLTASGA